jgi:hypothetical protein
LTLGQSSVIGAVQGLCGPFRGFSRSGATISTGMLLGVARTRVEAFSFALAVVLTPPVVLRELWRLARSDAPPGALRSTALLSVFGALVAFIAGLAALRWLSRWLETDRWYLFGIYCLIAAGAVEYLHTIGYSSSGVLRHSVQCRVEQETSAELRSIAGFHPGNRLQSRGQRFFPLPGERGDVAIDTFHLLHTDIPR